jgi:hypothetical protein
VAGAVNTASVTISQTIFPASGLTYTFTPSSTCLRPGVVVSSVTTSGATLDFVQNGTTPTNFEYVVSTSSTTPVGAGTAATGGTVNVSGLAPATLHYAFVRSDCGGGTFSDWSYSTSFTTACLSALSGTYTVNAGAVASATNFTSFSSLAGQLNNCGISGPVTVNVVAASGPYTEQFLLGAVAGTSSTNTITINGNGQTLQFLSTTTGERYRKRSYNKSLGFRCNNR